MTAAHLPIAGFAADYREELTAAATLLAAVGAAMIADRVLLRRGRALAMKMTGELTPVADTRLRLVRRLIFVTIIVLGVALALAQFESVKRVATGVLASSAVLGLVVGFAARQVLANALAGMMLAITQPIRIGDLVTFEDKTGTVEDIRLTYTYIRADDGRRVIVPNERLAQNTIENHTIVDPSVTVEVSVWVRPEIDAVRALELLSGLPDAEASVAEIDKEGVRFVVTTTAPTAGERGKLAAGLRATALERLRNERLSSSDAS
jgi:small-conductance mechanosensitive channel